jgi:hypothetical protein
MKLPSFKRLNKSDYQEDFKNLVDTLGNSLNTGIDSLYQLANKNVSIVDNIACSVRDVVVTVNSSGVPISNTYIGLDNIKPVLGTQVIRATNQTSTTVYPTGAIFISFTQTNTGLLINHITGLPANNKFLLKIIAYN